MSSLPGKWHTSTDSIYIHLCDLSARENQRWKSTRTIALALATNSEMSHKAASVLCVCVCVKRNQQRATMSPTSIHNWLTNLHTAIGRYRSVASSNSNSNQITSNDPLNRVSFSLPSFEPFSIPFFKLKLSTVSLSLSFYSCVLSTMLIFISISAP